MACVFEGVWFFVFLFAVSLPLSVYGLFKNYPVELQERFR